MPKLSDTRVPAYCHHRASGQGVVTLDGRDIYLGTYKSAASRAEYNRFIAEWLAAGRQLRADPQSTTVAEVVNAFRKHARTYYRDADGSVSRTVENFDEALRPVVKLYGKTPAQDFDSIRLEVVRNAMIEDGRVRSNINRHVARIRQVFKWAASKKMVTADVFQSLMTVDGLRRGRYEVNESEPIEPVAADAVEPVLSFVSRQVAAMIRLQSITGMRPGEVTIMRTGDIDRTGKLWIFRPHRHKTEIHGHTREIYLGPRAQEIITPFLKLDPTAYIFSPADAERERRDALHEKRLKDGTPLSCGNRPGTNIKQNPKRTVGDVYTVTAYYVAIQRACDKAFPATDGLDGDALLAWRKQHRWHPHQLRHTAATELRKTHGLEAAQCVLGHRTLTATQIYAAKNTEHAMRIMAEVG